MQSVTVRPLAQTLRIVLTLAAALFQRAALSQSNEAARGMLRRGDGSGELATLVEIAESGAMKLKTTAVSELMPGQVWRFGADAAVLRGPYLLLNDGSRLAAPVLTGDANELEFSKDEIHPGLWDGMRIAISQVRAILWKTPLGAKGLFACQELLKRAAVDTLRLDNGDLVEGEYRGIVWDEASHVENVVFVVRGVESRLAVSRCVSLQLASRTKVESLDAGDVWTLAFRDGSRVRARKLVVNDRGAAWQNSGGERWEVPAEEFRKNCTLVEPPRRDIVFLSDIADLAYRHLPNFGEAALFGRDRSALNEPLRHSGAFFEKGLGMWSSARLSCAVPDNAARFQAEICVDESAGDRGSVVFRVLAQMKGEKNAAIKDLYRSEVMRGGDASVQMSVDLRGAASLILLVEAADEGDVLDLADWIDARFAISSKAP